MKLIDKDALVAEIEKRLNFNEKLNAYSRLDECNAILSFINTLEVKEDEVKDNWEYIQDFIEKLGHFPKDSDELDVLINYVLSKKQKFALNKEVDLDKEIDKVWDTDYEDFGIPVDDFYRVARYFFELGLKAQKGE